MADEQQKIINRPLTAAQFTFAQGIIAGLTGLDAARKAGYKGTNNYLARIASENVRKCNIKAIIDAHKAKMAKKAEITAEKVIAELARVGFANIQDYIGQNNEVRDISMIDSTKAGAVESVQVDIRHDGGKSKGYTEKVRFRLHNKIAALESLCKYLGLFERDNSQKTPMQLVIVNYGQQCNNKQIESKDILGQEVIDTSKDKQLLGEKNEN